MILAGLLLVRFLLSAMAAGGDLDNDELVRGSGTILDNPDVQSDTVFGVGGSVASNATDVSDRPCTIPTKIITLRGGTFSELITDNTLQNGAFPELTIWVS